MATFPASSPAIPISEPERSTAWELGIDQALPGIDASVGVTYFHADMKDEIYGYAFDTTDPPDHGGQPARHQQAPRRRTDGDWRDLSPSLKISATYTYTDATEPDAITGEDVREIRRPRHTGSLGADWSSQDGRLELNANLSYTGTRNDDYWPPSFIRETVELGAYKLASLAATWRLNDATRIYTRDRQPVRQLIRGCLRLQHAGHRRLRRPALRLLRV